MYITAFQSKYLWFGHNFDEKPDPDDFQLHFHDTFEIYYFISGKGTFWVEGTPYKLHVGDILIFNMGEAHYIEVSPDLPYERITINFSKELLKGNIDFENLLQSFEMRPQGKNNLFKSTQFTDSFYKRCIKKIEENANGSAEQVISNLLPLLNEIYNAYQKQQNETLNENIHISSKIIQYINDNITENITPNDIANNFFISRSQLYSLFKETTGTSVWNFITVKRLNLAKSQLKDGIHPTKVYLNCGFNDYTSFFRAYKKHFGISPKCDYKCIK